MKSTFVSLAMLAILASVGAALDNDDTARISVLAYTIPWTSRMLDILAMAAPLVRRNHTFTAIVAQHLSHHASAYLDRSFGSATWPSGMQLIYYDALDLLQHNSKMVDMGPMEVLPHITTAFMTNCDILLANTTALGLMRAAQPDIFLGDVLDLCSSTLSDKLQLPRVDFETGAAGPVGELNSYGLGFPLAYIPTTGSGLPYNNMTLLQRAANVAISAIGRMVVHHFQVVPSVAYRARHNVSFNGASCADSTRRSVLLLSATSFAMAPARPVSPHIKHIGPLSPSPAQPLPGSIATFLTSSGLTEAILVSFGSQLSPGVQGLVHLAQALLQLPSHAVIWKMPAAERAAVQQHVDLGQFGPRLLLLDWLPQNDLLGHPAVKLFITHGGIHGLYEAAYHGKPIVGLPLAVDQDNNVLTAQQRGMCVALSREQLAAGPADVALAAISRVLQDSSFREAAERLSRRLRAAPRPPAEEAADWVEYAARVVADPGAFLVPHEGSMAGWQLALLDVYALLLSVVLLIAWLAVLVLRACLSLCGGGRSSGGGKQKGA